MTKPRHIQVLEQKLERLKLQLALETRVEEKMRLEDLIEQTEQLLNKPLLIAKLENPIEQTEQLLNKSLVISKTNHPEILFKSLWVLYLKFKKRFFSISIDPEVRLDDAQEQLDEAMQVYTQTAHSSWVKQLDKLSLKSNIFAGMILERAYRLGDRDLKANQLISLRYNSQSKKSIKAINCLAKSNYNSALYWQALSFLDLCTTGADKKAFSILLKIAQLNYIIAQNTLGWMYINGKGIERDEREGLIWYRKAAEQGYADAQYRLGWMYKSGIGVEKDEREAVVWYRKAAEQGYALGQTHLGWMYERGKGVEKDEREAVVWYRKAAEQGYALGQTNLGVMYENGLGVDKSLTTALQWYEKAAHQGNEDAKAAVKRLANQK